MEEIISSGMNNNMCIPNSINRLPDELLISIVSRLPLKDAVRSSIIAQKWRSFWVFNYFLDFDGSQVMTKLNDSTPNEWLYSERISFGNLVDSVLNLHSSTTIDQFRISFNLDSTNSDCINRWLTFAFTKRVKRLELDLLAGYTRASNPCYKFPNIFDPIERLCIFPIGLSCESLVALRLTRVAINGDVLEFLISKCPSLEELFVEVSLLTRSLKIISCTLRRLEIRDCLFFKTLEICAPSVLSRLEVHNCVNLRSLQIRSPNELSHLEIHECSNVGTLEVCSPNMLSHLEIHECRDLSTEICAPNLLSFALWGSNTSIALKNVTSLVNLSVGADHSSETLADNLVQISRVCLSRLETLLIRLSIPEVHFWLPNIPNLPRLNKLVLNFVMHGYEDFVSFASVIDAAPILREIVLKLDVSPNPALPRFRAPLRSRKGQIHECLEVLQIVGFAGLDTDVELAHYVIEHAVSLKKVIIEYYRPLDGGEVVTNEIERMEIAREGLGLVQAKLTQGVELIVL